MKEKKKKNLILSQHNKSVEKSFGKKTLVKVKNQELKI